MNISERVEKNNRRVERVVVGVIQEEIYWISPFCFSPKGVLAAVRGCDVFREKDSLFASPEMEIDEHFFILAPRRQDIRIGIPWVMGETSEARSLARGSELRGI